MLSLSKCVIFWVCYDIEFFIVWYCFLVKYLLINEYVIFFYVLKILVNFLGLVIIIGGGRIVVKYEEG